MVNSKNWLERGKAFHERGDYDQAIDSFKKALNLDPNNPDILIRIGLSYRYKREYDIAIEWYEKVLQIDPKDKLALNNIAYAYECKEEYEKAIEMYERALEIDPAYELPLVNLIKLLKTRKEFQKAIEIIEKTIKVDPVNPGNWIDLGLLLTEIEEYEKAVDAYNKAIFYEPTNIAYNNLGWTYYNNKDYQKAIKAFKKSLEMDWKYDLPYRNLNKIYDDFVKNDIEELSLWKNLAEAYYVAKDYKYALSSCNRAIELEGEYKGTLKDLKIEILDAKQKSDAKARLDNMIDLALFTFSKIGNSVFLSDVIGYIKYKSPELKISSSEIKYRIIEYIERKGRNIQLNDNKLLMLKEDRANDQKLII
ncbi:MAG: tetratricopeptide repeat protein [Candidatus Lokiarchaeota archaeon]